MTGLGLGGQVVGLFSADGKRIPFSTLSATDRRFTLLGLCSRVTIVSPAGHAPFLRCLDGAPRIEEVANDGVTFTWKLSYPNGTTCTGSGRLRGFRDPQGGLSRIQTMHCDTVVRRGTALVPAHAASLLPTPERPITTDIGITMNPRNGRARILRASGLAGAGIETVGLVAKDGSVLRAQVRGRSYDFRGPILEPALDSDRGLRSFGQRGLSQANSCLSGPTSPVDASGSPSPADGLLRAPVGRPLQQATNDIGVIAVYRKGLVLRFSRTARAERVMRRVAGGGRIPLPCAHLAYGAGTWLDVGAGGSAQLRGRTAILGYAFWANGRPPTPLPPFDYCQVTGLYGRRWNDQVRAARAPRGAVHADRAPLLLRAGGGSRPRPLHPNEDDASNP